MVSRQALLSARCGAQRGRLADRMRVRSAIAQR